MAARDNVQIALKELCEQTKKILEERIARYGTNPKTGRNTLQGSNLEKSITVKPTEDGLALQIVDYWEFISRGLEHTSDYPNTMSAFIKNIDAWVAKNGIRFPNMTQTQVIFAIIRNIFNHGLKARPFMVYDEGGDLEKMIPELGAYIDKWFDELFDLIMADIDKYFNNGN